MAVKRRPFQGVFNIVRFNWHFYLISGIGVAVLFLLRQFIPDQLYPILLIGSILLLLTIVVSLIVSYYVYDFSGLYQLEWLPNSDLKKVLNINAGFDETSEIIKAKFPKTDLVICDFYDEDRHTEVSIKRARIAYPPLQGTIAVFTDGLPFGENVFDYTLAILSAHEIRNKSERVAFFKELGRVTKPGGKILVMEHVRDLNNFMAFSIGFFHFYSKSDWLNTFNLANLRTDSVIDKTPFIKLFTLDKNGHAF